MCVIPFAKCLEWGLKFSVELNMSILSSKVFISGKFQSSSTDFTHKVGTLQQKGLFATSGSTLELAFVRNSFQASLPLVVHKK